MKKTKLNNFYLLDLSFFAFLSFYQKLIDKRLQSGTLVSTIPKDISNVFQFKCLNVH